MLYVLADAHAGTDPAEDRALIELVGSMSGGELLILGDLFRSFVGLDRYWSPGQREVLDAISEFRRRGGFVRFVVGNRDYLVTSTPNLPFDEVIEDRAVLQLAGQRTLVTHGDRLDPKDYRYRAWRRLSRSAAAEFILRRLPGAVGQRVARRTEATLSHTNQTYKAGPLPVEALHEFGREAARAGAVLGLVGHFHHDETVTVPGGAPVQLAPPWLEHRRLLIGAPDGSLRSVSGAEISEPGGRKLG